MFRLTKTLACALACVSLATNAYASPRGARDSAMQQALILYASGVRALDTARMGYLARGASVVVPIDLVAGELYVLVAGGCEDAYDIDLQLFDSFGRLVGDHVGQDPYGVLLGRVAFSGRYLAKVTMYDSTANGAHFTLLAGR